MTVIAFLPGPAGRRVGRDGGWRAAELETIVQSLTPPLGSGQAGGWDVGVTEIGDPQFYLLGPPPHDECILCISRLGRVYVLEDGAGQVLFEHNSLVVLAEQATSVLRKKKAQIVARAALIWCAVRATFEEKLEVVMGESEELLTHVAPQLAAFA
jgi:hypothetical protein